jgi:hypothetical protein
MIVSRRLVDAVFGMHSHWTRIRRTGGLSNGAVVSLRGQFSAAFIIIIAGCCYRQGQISLQAQSWRQNKRPTRATDRRD